MKYRTPDLLCFGSVMDLTNFSIPSQIHAQRAMENGAAVRDVSKDIKAPPIPREESSEVIQIFAAHTLVFLHHLMLFIRKCHCQGFLGGALDHLWPWQQQETLLHPDTLQDVEVCHPPHVWIFGFPK